MSLSASKMQNSTYEKSVTSFAAAPVLRTVVFQISAFSPGGTKKSSSTSTPSFAPTIRV